MPAVDNRLGADVPGAVGVPSGFAGPFDFVLDGPMWEEYVHACSAYGRGVRLLFMWAGPLLAYGAVGTSLDPTFMPGKPVEKVLVELLIGFLGLFGCGVVLSGWLATRAASGWTLVRAPDWFDLPEWLGRDGLRLNHELRHGGFVRWRTPCRLLVLDEGVVLVLRPRAGGEPVEVMARWADLDCVRVTDRAVVLCPSARGSVGVDFESFPTFEFGRRRGNAVMVARSVLPDVSAFVSFCRSRVAGAHVSSHARVSGVRGVVSRVVGWLLALVWGDRRVDWHVHWTSHKVDRYYKRHGGRPHE